MRKRDRAPPPPLTAAAADAPHMRFSRGAPTPDAALPSQAAEAADPLSYLEARQFDDDTRYVVATLGGLVGSFDGYDERLFELCTDYLATHAEETRQRAKRGAAAAVVATAGVSSGAASHDEPSNETATSSPKESWHRRLHVFLEMPHSSAGARAFYGVMTALVVLSSVGVVMETMPQFNPQLNPSMKVVWLGLDWSQTAVFTAETVARFVTHVLDDRIPASKAQNVIGFLRRPANVVDIAALLPTYFAWAVSSSGRLVTGSLRTIRLLRILKFMRRFVPIWQLLIAVRRSAAGLVAPLLFLTLGVLLASSIVFFVESGTFDSAAGAFIIENPDCLASPRGFLPQFANDLVNSTVAGTVFSRRCPVDESRFRSMGQTLYFGIVTMATVGFGDFVPVTPIGKVVSGAAIICGILIIAMPIAMIGNNYTNVMEQQRAEKEKRRDARRSALAESNAFVATGLLGEHDLGDEDSAVVALGPGAQQFRTPSETFFQQLMALSRAQTVDLANPGDHVLFLTDLLLEATAKQLLNLECDRAGEERLFHMDDAPTPEAKVASPHAPMKRQRFKQQWARLPVWTATVQTTTPAQYFYDVVTETVTLSRPVVLSVGAGDPETRADSEVAFPVASGSPDIAVYTPAIAEQHQTWAMSAAAACLAHDRASAATAAALAETTDPAADARPDSDVRRGSDGRRSSTPKHTLHLTDSTASIAEINGTIAAALAAAPICVSQRHATIVVTHVWNEPRVLIRNAHGCGMALIRRRSDSDVIAAFDPLPVSHELFGAMFPSLAALAGTSKSRLTDAERKRQRQRERSAKGPGCAAEHRGGDSARRGDGAAAPVVRSHATLLASCPRFAVVLLDSGDRPTTNVPLVGALPSDDDAPLRDDGRAPAATAATSAPHSGAAASAAAAAAEDDEHLLVDDADDADDADRDASGGFKSAPNGGGGSRAGSERRRAAPYWYDIARVVMNNEVKPLALHDGDVVVFGSSDLLASIANASVEDGAEEAAAATQQHGDTPRSHVPRRTPVLEALEFLGIERSNALPSAGEITSLSPAARCLVLGCLFYVFSDNSSLDVGGADSDAAGLL